MKLLNYLIIETLKATMITIIVMGCLIWILESIS